MATKFPAQYFRDNQAYLAAIRTRILKGSQWNILPNSPAIKLIILNCTGLARDGDIRTTYYVQKKKASSRA